MSDAPLHESSIGSLDLIGRGKVRDLYAVDDDWLLIVASDRLSAFDVVLPDPIPGKGAVLTGISEFWFRRTGELTRNHRTGAPALEAVLSDPAELAAARGRAMVVRRLQPLPIEAIVRGYLIGSGWREYRATGSVCGIGLPEGLRQAERLPEPLFTPSTKAEAGEHDENIDFDTACRLIGPGVAGRVRDIALDLYRFAAEHARARGIIIADTKFEFAVDEDGELVLIDEVLTPDSSRFWPADEYAPGMSPPSFDKQFVRDYLDTLDWDKTPPAPSLPAEVVAKTAEKYREAERRLVA